MLVLELRLRTRFSGGLFRAGSIRGTGRGGYQNVNFNGALVKDLLTMQLNLTILMWINLKICVGSVIYQGIIELHVQVINDFVICFVLFYFILFMKILFLVVFMNVIVGKFIYFRLSNGC